MARTEAPAAPVAAPPAPAPAPATPVPERPTTVLAWPSEWPVPVPSESGRKSRRRAGRGVPVAPVLAASGNATAMAATAAYQVGGVVGVAATGVVVAAGATAAVVKRRAAVKRGVAVRAGRGGVAGGRRVSGGGSLGLGSLGSAGRSGASRGRGPGGATTGGSGGAGRRSASGPLGSPRGATKSTGGLGSKAASTKGATGSRSGLPGLGSGSKGRHGSSPAGPKSQHSGHGKPKAGKAAGIKAAIGRAARATMKRDGAPRKIGAAVGRHTLGRKSLPYKGVAALGRGVKKGTKGAWRSKARKATGRRMKQLGGATLDGLRSLVAATWTGIRKRDRKAVLARLRDVWSRRRTARKNKTAPTAPAVPAVAGSVRRPTTTTSTGGTVMPGGHHFVAPAMEMARIAANYSPTGMLQVGEDFAGLQQALELNAEAMKITVENADTKFPLDPRIVEVMRQIHQLQLKAADLAQDLPAAFEHLHQVDLERLRNPRKGKTGESMWDATVNL